MTALLFLGDEGKSVAFIMSWEIDRNWPFEGTEDTFFLGMLSSRGHWPHAIFQSNILNLLKNSASFLSHHLSLSTDDPSHVTEKADTSLAYTTAFFSLRCLYLHMWCFLLMVHIFFLTLLSLGSACRLSIMCLHSVLHGLFSSHLLLPTHTSIWKTNSSFFVGLSFPFFSFPFLSFFFFFSKLIYTQLPLIPCLLIPCQLFGQFVISLLLPQLS